MFGTSALQRVETIIPQTTMNYSHTPIALENKHGLRKKKVETCSQKVQRISVKCDDIMKFLLGGCEIKVNTTTYVQIMAT